jgi:hypothetical protein
MPEVENYDNPVIAIGKTRIWLNARDPRVLQGAGDHWVTETWSE